MLVISFTNGRDTRELPGADIGFSDVFTVVAFIFRVLLTYLKQPSSLHPQSGMCRVGIVEGHSNRPTHHPQDDGFHHRIRSWILVDDDMMLAD